MTDLEFNVALAYFLRLWFWPLCKCCRNSVFQKALFWLLKCHLLHCKMPSFAA